MSGVDLQSKVMELQLPVFNPSQGDSSRKEVMGREAVRIWCPHWDQPSGESLPVVPAKLVKRIIKGDYLDMSEMLSDNMEVER